MTDALEGCDLVFSHLISQSPPHRLGRVVEYCRQLAAPHEFSEDVILRCCRDWNEANLLPLDFGQGKQGLVCRLARDDGLGGYLDLRHSRSFEVDHPSQRPFLSFSPLLDDVACSSVHAYRVVIEQELDKFVARHYDRPNTVAVAACFCSTAGLRIKATVAISSKHHRPRGFWSSSWTSFWNIEFAPSNPDEQQLEGTLQLTTHHFEEGNVQFRHRGQKKVVVAAFTEPIKFAKDLVKAISLAESAFHMEADDALVSFSAGPLKVLRRVLPLSKERFDWRPFRHALVSDLKSAVKEATS